PDRCACPTAAEIDRNPDLRGSIRVARSGWHFEYADGTPFFLLADTAWAANTARCGLGERRWTGGNSHPGATRCG
ncbi:MAG: hypothetical protein L0271_03410, partial [Gemmatimonadetes bacterium]|nr:hypothetical protein [Gemmatimonadota bacterium]